MNPIIIIDEKAQAFSEKIIPLCKPLMLCNKHKKLATAILNSESNLRMTLEMAVNTTLHDDLKQKLTLSKQEIEWLLEALDTLPNLNENEKHAIKLDGFEIKEMINDLISL